MLMNLTDVLTSEGKVVEKQVEIDIVQIDSRLGDFPIIEKTPVTLTLTNIGTNQASIEGKMELTFAMNCDRCLKPVLQKVILDFTRVVEGPDAYTKDAEDDDQNFMEGYQLNIDDLIKNECFMNLPTKVLCQPDCVGICMQCGKDLNEGQCACDTFVPDPRMARIKDIFDANKEV
ncbi:YceD family protein [Kineothrix sp. MB12-C1]|uniref:YceD family protein n=1 Tax=Kineothrix sp. MB12-C1 TaxID=3070215 RepID=UPI0027D3012D|nr:DUF177 domain-containing protein [Kineothrix sp. MB12-C1]WMC92647.1 DUF177 domain-containing protein [Kineothrix sp. MB12-C1]